MKRLGCPTHTDKYMCIIMQYITNLNLNYSILMEKPFEGFGGKFFYFNVIREIPFIWQNWWILSIKKLQKDQISYNSQQSCGWRQMHFSSKYCDSSLLSVTALIVCLFTSLSSADIHLSPLLVWKNGNNQFSLRISCFSKHCHKIVFDWYS